MKLKQFLVERRLTNAQFGKLIGVHKSTIGRYIAGETTPSPTRMKRIYKTTEGQVTVNDFLQVDELSAEAA